jgi:hypothetical protein
MRKTTTFLRASVNGHKFRLAKLANGSATRLDVAVSNQSDQSSVGRLEFASIEVKGSQGVFKVDMKPFAALCLGLLRTELEHLCRDSVVAIFCGDHSVQNECVHAAVPGDIDESDELLIVVGADPAKAMACHLCTPVICQQTVVKGFGVKNVQGFIGEVAAPGVVNVHKGLSLNKLNRGAGLNSGEPIHTPQFAEALLAGLCGSSFARRIFATCSACLRAISVIVAAKALYRWSCLSRSKVVP